MKINPFKITISILGFLFLFSINLTAQSFIWGNSASSMKENDAKMSYSVDSKFYQIYSKYNDKVFNKDVIVNSFSLTDLNKNNTVDLSIAQPAMGKATATHLEMYQENGISYIIFLDDYNTKTKERELYWQRVNIDTNVKTKPELITSMPTRNSNYFIAQSPNKLFYAVIKQHSPDKKLNEKINVALIDKNLKVVKELTFETPYMNKTPLDNKLFVSNEGNVFIVKEVDMAKTKPFKTVYFWDGKSTTMQETTLKFENDFQIYQYQGHFDGSDFYIHGLYTRIGSKGVQAYGGSLPAAGIYAARFNGKGEKVYIVTSDTGEIAGLNLKEFVFEGMKTWLFADKLFTLKKNKPTVPGATGSFNFEYDYTYSNDAIVFGKLDNETGKLEWYKDLKYEEPNTVNDNGAFLSYLYFLKNNQLTILYNDSQKTMLANKTYTDRFTAIETFDDRGNQISKSLVAATGLELKLSPNSNSLEENFDLDTSVNITVKEGKYIVRAKSASNEKFGYLSF